MALKFPWQPSATDGPPPRGSRRGVQLLVAGWFFLTSLVGAWTLAQHLLPLPAARLTAQSPGPVPAAWYVLGEDCGCSAAIATDLAQRGPQGGWREKVLLVGTGPDSAIAAQLQGAGFTVERITAEALVQRHAIQGVPWLVLFNARGDLAYSGGYSQGRPGVAGSTNLMAGLMTAVARGESVAALPAYGCATSQALRQRLDPLGLRFSSFP